MSVIVVSNPAPRGPAGKTILNGTGAPTGAVGNNGDFYFDTTNSLFYGPKENGVWPPPIPVGSVSFADQAEVDAGVETGKAIAPDTYQQGLTNRLASQVEAEAGVEATKLMTPERVAQAIAALANPASFASQGEADAGTETAKVISPATLQNAITNRTATQAEAEAGAENTRMMTPLRVAQAIIALGQNLIQASMAEAQAGVENTKFMTALRVAEAIAAQVPGLVPDLASQAEAEAGTENTKIMTALRVAQAITALGQNLALASQAEAEAGTDNTKFMSPLRVAEAIAALGGGGAPFATQGEVDAGVVTTKTISPATFQQGVTNRQASQVEAEAGIDNVKLMTALRVAQAIAALGQNLLAASQAEAEAGVENTKYVTSLRVAQAIAALGQSLTLASQAEAEAGVENTKYMTPLRVAEAIAALGGGGGGGGLQYVAPSISGTQTDYAIGTEDFVFARFSGTSATINSIVANGEARRILIYPIGGNITLKYLGTGLAANRIINEFDVDFVIPVNGWAEIAYDVASSLWRVIGSSSLVLNRVPTSGQVVVTGGTAPTTLSGQLLRLRASSRTLVLEGQVEWLAPGTGNTKVAIDISGWTEAVSRLWPIIAGSAVANYRGTPVPVPCYVTNSQIVIDFPVATDLSAVHFSFSRAI